MKKYYKIMIQISNIYSIGYRCNNDERIKWKEVVKIMNNYYNFNIEDK